MHFSCIFKLTKATVIFKNEASEQCEGDETQTVV